MVDTMSTPLTFGELKVGDKFIAFPADGDDSGHGGYRRGSYVFEKTVPVPRIDPATGKPDPLFERVPDNYRRLVDDNSGSVPDSMAVFRVLL